MESTDRKEYAEFEKRVKRTVFLDNLSPQVTESVLRTALDQFGTVKSVHLIPNYLEQRITQRFALVEMETPQQVSAVISTVSQFPFMISGMPRPVRAKHAKADMFDDKPRKPGRKLDCRWLEPTDPDFGVAEKMKKLVKKHASEASFLLKHQLEQEEKLAQQQKESLNAVFKKYELIDSVISDKTALELANCYNMKQAADL